MMASTVTERLDTAASGVSGRPRWDSRGTRSGCHPACGGSQMGQGLDCQQRRDRMRTLSAKDAKYGFGRLVDLQGRRF